MSALKKFSPGRCIGLTATSWLRILRKHISLNILRIKMHRSNVIIDEKVQLNGTRSFSISSLTPTAKEFAKNITSLYLTFNILCTIAVLLIVGNFFLHAYFIFKYIAKRSRASKLLWLAGLYPTVGTVSVLAMWIPRSFSISDMIIMLYFARCLYVYVDYVIDCFGGREKMSQALAGVTIKMNTPPCCCCCSCLPDLPATAKNIQWLSMLAKQNALIRPFTFYILALLFVDDFNSKSIIFAVGILTTVSSMVAFYGITLFSKAAMPSLSHFKVDKLKIFVQTTIVLHSIQEPIFTNLGSYEVFDSGPLLHGPSAASYWLHCLLIGESLIMSLLSSLIFRPQVNAAFDRFPRKYSQSNPEEPAVINDKF
ncbi:Organic solute transporter alpha-like protein 3 [Trichinella nelsoni]|uniref:Organic solute transporter alpha-like protein 3 n=1 Tax=Trichinella nelsoni TaxID=6336 RepID=A0A0V0RTE1_9BILA|nr:Organic solute transporter alpha-like protein 3 [Trichinella nelsoni]